MTIFPNIKKAGLLEIQGYKMLVAVVLCGPPCSGKSTYRISAYPEYTVASTDLELDKISLRLDLSYEEAFASYYKEAEQTFNKIISSEPKFLVVDRTNLTAKSRSKLLKNQLKNYKIKIADCPKRIILRELLYRNKTREQETGKYIPVDILTEMYDRYEKPSLDEGFNYIREFSW